MQVGSHVSFFVSYSESRITLGLMYVASCITLEPVSSKGVKVSAKISDIFVRVGFGLRSNSEENRADRYGSYVI